MIRLAAAVSWLALAPAAMARLEGMRDIDFGQLHGNAQLPEPISWWPPAPGWWLLLAAALLAAPAWRWLRERTGEHRRKWQAARRELVEVRRKYHAEGDARQLVRDLSVWLRRAAMALYGRRVAASLSGDEWLRFLDEPLKVRAFARGAGAVLAVMPYRDRGIVDADVMLALCEQWLLAHLKSSAMQGHLQAWLRQGQEGAAAAGSEGP